MSRRDLLTFRSEMRTRNAILEYFIDWLLMSHPRNVQQSTGVLFDVDAASACYRQLDIACMRAAAVIVDNLPLQPSDVQESHATNVLDAKSRLFQRYFNLLMTVLDDCAAMTMTSSSTGGGGGVQSTTAQHEAQSMASGTNTMATGGTAGAQQDAGIASAVALSSSAWQVYSAVAAPPTASAPSAPSSQVLSRRHTTATVAACVTQASHTYATTLRTHTLATMAGMLAANIDCGLAFALATHIHRNIHAHCARRHGIRHTQRDGHGRQI
jgi:hypothetical protein